MVRHIWLQRKCVFLIFLFIMMCDRGIAFSSDAEVGPITLQYPPDMLIMEFGLLGMSLSVPEGSSDLITARRNGKEVVRIIPDLKYECFTVPLQLGRNEIHIEAMKNGSKVYESSVSVFRRSDLVSQYKDAPKGYRKSHFHMTYARECAECHELDPKEHDKKPVSPTSFIAESFDKMTVIASTSTCYSCHKKIAASPYVHGPVAVWSCLSCHELNPEDQYSVKKPDTEVCFACHKEQKDDWASKQYTHGPVTIGKCAICHSPHSADYPANLYKNTWDLCVNCHAEKGSGRHVLGDAFSTEGHPTRDRPDPVRIGKELSCASCHTPHASNYPHLWAFEVDSIFELCKKCHFDK